MAATSCRQRDERNEVVVIHSCSVWKGSDLAMGDGLVFVSQGAPAAKSAPGLDEEKHKSVIQ